MLGAVAKKLRMFGFDCKYDSTIDDDYLILDAKREGRIIITRDAMLAKNAIQHDVMAIKLQSKIEKEQLVEIAKKINWKKFELQYSRCSLCNGMLNVISKDQIAQEIPPKTSEFAQEFWQCSTCSHVYWVGTHIRSMERSIAEINARL